MKYDFVLVPNADEVIQALIHLAKEISIDRGLEPEYLLKDKEKWSIPHISVVQFELETFNSDKEALLELIWKYSTEAWQEVLADSDNKQELTCILSSKINYKHDTTGPFAGKSWAEVLLNKLENPLLQKFHDTLHEKLKLLGIKCLNASADCYNPHITLFNTQTYLLERTELIQEIPKLYKAKLTSFSVIPSLGTSNEQWELTAVLYKNIQQKEAISKTKCTL